MKKEPKLVTKCEHQFIDWEQMKQFGRDQCEICGEWIHREEITKNLIKQIENNLIELKKLNT